MFKKRMFSKIYFLTVAFYKLGKDGLNEVLEKLVRRIERRLNEHFVRLHCQKRHIFTIRNITSG